MPGASKIAGALLDKVLDTDEAENGVVAVVYVSRGLDDEIGMASNVPANSVVELLRILLRRHDAGEFTTSQKLPTG